MAQKRYINTSFWTDNYVLDKLSPDARYVFLYLLTNPNTNIAGKYEISLRQMAFQTGYDDAMLLKMLGRLEKDEKLIYRGGWIVLLNWEKHQGKSPQVLEGIKRINESLPSWLQDLIKEAESGQTTMLNTLEV